MAGVAYASSLVLAGVFIWAGAAKLSEPIRTRDAFRDLDVPRPDVFVWVIPSLEIGTGVLLLVRPRLGGGFALVALAVFSFVLARVMRRGLEVRCGCLGSASSDEVSSAELLRNAMLTVLGAGALLVKSPTVPALPDVIVTSTAVLIGVVVVGLLRIKRRLGVVWDNTLPGEAAP